jgi:hypothetical protein
LQEGKLNIIEPDVQLRDPDDLDVEPDQNQNAAEASTSTSITAEISVPVEPTIEQSTHKQISPHTFLKN